MTINEIATKIKAVPEVKSVTVLGEDIINIVTIKIDVSIRIVDDVFQVAVFYADKMTKQFAVESVDEVIENILFEHKKHC